MQARQISSIFLKIWSVILIMSEQLLIIWEIGVVGQQILLKRLYIYIYIKPKLLKLSQFFTSALFIKINKILNTVIVSNPISISSQNKPDNLQLLNNTQYKRKCHTLLSLSLFLLQTQTQPNKHCKTHTLSLSLYPSPSPKPKSSFKD